MRGQATVQEIQELKDAIRTIPDFPVAGILFKDLTPIMGDPALLRRAVDALAEFARARGAEVIVGIEARGFVFGTGVALELGLPFVPVRKAGKLPAECVRASYALEYGTATIEMHRDAFPAGAKVVVMDDLLATGGTAKATCELVEATGGIVVGCGFITELTFLPGRASLEGYEVATFVRFGAGE
jgi:adenine phosphoribosyltransferase